MLLCIHNKALCVYLGVIYEQCVTCVCFRTMLGYIHVKSVFAVHSSPGSIALYLDVQTSAFSVDSCRINSTQTQHVFLQRKYITVTL